MKAIFDRYERDIIPKKGARTQRVNLSELCQLRPVFDSVPIEALTPAMIAQYRDARLAKVRANCEISTLSHVFSMAREWGLTAKENSCQGVRKNKKTPRDFYANDAVWEHPKSRTLRTHARCWGTPKETLQSAFTGGSALLRNLRSRGRFGTHP